MRSPGWMRRALSAAGKPVEKVLAMASTSSIPGVQHASELVTRGVHRALELSLTAAQKTYSEEALLRRLRERSGMTVERLEDLRDLPLETLDDLADSYNRGHGAMLAAEGALLGAATTLAEGIPFAQLAIPSLIAMDVSASMTLLSRHTASVAAAYGYSARDPQNRFHILAAMAPQHEAHDGGYAAAKAAAVEAIHEAGLFASRRSQMILAQEMLEKEAPRLVRLMNYVAARLGVVITEKELGMLVPIAGAALNGGLNLAFQQVGHTAAKDYFRLLLLEKRYGESAVREALKGDDPVLP